MSITISLAITCIYLKIPNKYDQLKIAPMLTDIFRHALVYNFDEKTDSINDSFNRNQK